MTGNRYPARARRRTVKTTSSRSGSKSLYTVEKKYLEMI
jgi:hypothetical protein